MRANQMLSDSTATAEGEIFLFLQLSFKQQPVSSSQPAHCYRQTCQVQNTLSPLPGFEEVGATIWGGGSNDELLDTQYKELDTRARSRTPSARSWTPVQGAGHLLSL